MPTTANLLLTHIEAAQLQPEVTANEAIDAIDGKLGTKLTITFASADFTLDIALARKTFYVDCTGTLGAQRQLILPALKAWYFVKNNTGEANNIEVITTGEGSTSFTLADTEGQLFYSDATTTYRVAGKV